MKSLEAVYAKHIYTLSSIYKQLCALTAEACLGHGVGAVVEPLGRVWANVGLRGGVRHGIIADPGRQVDVESVWVHDAVCIHQPLTSQLQNPDKERERARD